MRELAEKMLPVYERAIGPGLAPGTLKAHFTDPHVNYRLAHYPITPDMKGKNSGIRLYGANPHADYDFFTILAPNDVPGLSIQLPTGEWMDVPARPGTFVVNTGEMLYRLTNGRFRNTVHQVINKSGGDRNAVVFFLNLDRDFRMTPVLETPAEEPKWPPFTSLDVLRDRSLSSGKGACLPNRSLSTGKGACLPNRSLIFGIGA